MIQRLIHPGLMTSLFRFFNSKCAIQNPTIVSGDLGNSDPSSWASSETDIDCVISRISNSSEGNEVRRKDKTIVLHPYGIILDGVFTVTEKDRILSDSVAYDILTVDYDSKSTMTSLVCELIK
jgi:hypothetical protein